MQVGGGRGRRWHILYVWSGGFNNNPTAAKTLVTSATIYYLNTRDMNNKGEKMIIITKEHIKVTAGLL